MSRSPAAILYDSNGNPISSLLDGADRRLQVEAALKDGTSVTIDTIPANPETAVRDFLRNAGSRDMNVDGSGTPVVFSYPADPTYDIALTEVRIVFNCSSLPMKGEDFGADIPLTNGVEFAVVSNGNTTVLGTFLINEDFVALPTRGGLNLIYDGPSNDQLAASFNFGGRVPLRAGTSDEVKITIQDDLTLGSAHKVVLFWAAIYGVKVM